MKTGFSLLEILHRENPVFITGMGLQCYTQKEPNSHRTKLYFKKNYMKKILYIFKKNTLNATS